MAGEMERRLGKDADCKFQDATIVDSNPRK